MISCGKTDVLFYEFAWLFGFHFKLTSAKKYLR